MAQAPPGLSIAEYMEGRVSDPLWGAGMRFDSRSQPPSISINENSSSPIPCEPVSPESDYSYEFLLQRLYQSPTFAVERRTLHLPAPIIGRMRKTGYLSRYIVILNFATICSRLGRGIREVADGICAELGLSGRQAQARESQRAPFVRPHTTTLAGDLHLVRTVTHGALAGRRSEHRVPAFTLHCNEAEER